MKVQRTSGRQIGLLCSVSALALFAALGWARRAEASEIAGGAWSVELDGRYDIDATGRSQNFTPSPGIPDSAIDTRNGHDTGGKITFQPTGSPFSYAMSIRYGRTQNASRSFADSHPTSFGTYNQAVDENQHISHTTVDFEVGKDVGIGLFGSGTTTVGGGLRYAHFDAVTRGNFSTSSKYTHRAGQFKVERRSNLLGPRLFARTTSPLPGSLGEQGFSLGLGAGAGVLFGRQSTKNELDLTSGTAGPFAEFSRSKQVTVPTLDASAQVNWSIPQSPLTLSAGYRYDGAYHVLDGGSAASRNEINSVQHGPFLGLTLKL